VSLGFGLVDQTKFVTAASELARNTLDHGGGGSVLIELIQNERKPGIRLVFEDNGPGIPNLELALTDGYTSGHGVLRRMKYAVRCTILTRTDSGGETFATWRFGRAYGAAFLSNEWHPDRVNTVRSRMSQGSAQIGFDLLSNFGSEFIPDLKRKLLHKRSIVQD
jgi:hypothetical protein